MSKTDVLNWNSFVSGSNVHNEITKPIWLKVATVVHLALIPQPVFAAAAGEETWSGVFTTVLGIADWLCVGIITYSGITWMFGNRTKAMEFIMGGSIGYIIIRHAVDIKNWLKLL